MDMVTYLMLKSLIQKSKGAVSENFAPEYDPSRTYEAGDYAIIDGILYKYTGSQWNEANVGDALKELQNGKLNSNQGEENAGKFMVVDDDGNVVPMEGSGGTVIIDHTLSIRGAAADAKVTGDSISKERKRVDALYKLTEGQLWDTEIGDSPAYMQNVEAGGILADVNKIAGRTVVWNQMVGATKQIPESSEMYQKTVPENTLSAEVNSIGGKTIVWNQLNRNNASGDDVEEVHFTKNSDGSWSAAGTATGNASKSLAAYGTGILGVAGHKYLIYSGLSIATYIAADGSISYMTGSLTNNGSTVFTLPNNRDGSKLVLIFRTVGDHVYDTSGYAFFCDLTVMFGAGNEPADNTDPRVPGIIEYALSHLAFDEGSLLSAAVTEVQSFRNDWDKIGYAVESGMAGEIFKPGDKISVPISTGGATAVNYDFDVLGIDEDEPVDENLSHVLTIQAHDVLDYGSIPFDPVQYLFVVTAEACAEYGWPATGMPAGTYNVTLDHGAYDGSTRQDGTYQFTTTQIVPVGGGVRHTQIGVYQGDGAYTKETLLAGTFTTYDADRTTTLESELVTTEGSDGTSLGTTTASNPVYKVGSYINFSQRQGYGYSRWSTSFLRQYLNSDTNPMTFAPATIWSRPMTTLPEGFLHKLPEALKAVLGKVRKRYALNISDGYSHEDVEDTVNIVTMLDIGFGQNNNVSEGPVSADGIVTRETPYTHWTGAEDADRIKYRGTTPLAWGLGSSHPSYANYERGVYTSGALSGSGANGVYGVVPSLHITGNGAAPLDTLEIPVSLRTYLADKGYGQSAGSVYNELNLETKKYIQRVSAVDMGTISWNRTDDNPIVWFTPNGVPSAVNHFVYPRSDTIKYNILCADYVTTSKVNNTDKTCYGGASIYYGFHDESLNGMTMQEVAAHFSGKMLYGELATPIEYDISSYLTDDNTLTVEPGGNLTFVQTATQLPVPVSLDWEKTAWTETLDSTHKYIYVEDGTETFLNGAASQAIAGTDRGLIDLTRMIGTGSEYGYLTEKQSRYVLEYRAENPEKNAGELVSAKVTGVKSVGKNIFKMREPDYKGQAAIPGYGGTDVSVDKNEIIIPAYAAAAWDVPTAIGSSYVVSIDGDFNHAFSIDNGGTSIGNKKSFIASSAITKIAIGSTSGSGESIKVQLERGSTATSYTPYMEDIIEIPIFLREYLSDKGYGYSAGNVYNEIDWVRKVYIQRVESVDMGTLTWSKEKDNTFSINLPRSILSGALLTEKYVQRNAVSPAYSNYPDKSIWNNVYLYSQKNVVIKDTSYNDSLAFKTAMSGVILLYELAEPIEYDISSYLPADNSLEVETGGTITFVQSNDLKLEILNEVEYLVKLEEVVGA